MKTKSHYHQTFLLAFSLHITHTKACVVLLAAATAAAAAAAATLPYPNSTLPFRFRSPARQKCLSPVLSCRPEHFSLFHIHNNKASALLLLLLLLLVFFFGFARPARPVDGAAASVTMASPPTSYSAYITLQLRPPIERPPRLPPPSRRLSASFSALKNGPSSSPTIYIIKQRESILYIYIHMCVCVYVCDVLVAGPSFRQAHTHITALSLRTLLSLNMDGDSCGGSH